MRKYEKTARKFWNETLKSLKELLFNKFCDIFGKILRTLDRFSVNLWEDLKKKSFKIEISWNTKTMKNFPESFV